VLIIVANHLEIKLLLYDLFESVIIGQFATVISRLFISKSQRRVASALSASQCIVCLEQHVDVGAQVCDIQKCRLNILFRTLFEDSKEQLHAPVHGLIPTEQSHRERLRRPWKAPQEIGDLDVRVSGKGFLQFFVLFAMELTLACTPLLIHAQDTTYHPHRDPR
jgi:hypothetical protein